MWGFARWRASDCFLESLQTNDLRARTCSARRTSELRLFFSLAFVASVLGCGSSTSSSSVSGNRRLPLAVRRRAHRLRPHVGNCDASRWHEARHHVERDVVHRQLADGDGQPDGNGRRREPRTTPALPRPTKVATAMSIAQRSSEFVERGLVGERTRRTTLSQRRAEQPGDSS